MTLFLNFLDSFSTLSNNHYAFILVLYKCVSLTLQIIGQSQNLVQCLLKLEIKNTMYIPIVGFLKSKAVVSYTYEWHLISE